MSTKFSVRWTVTLGLHKTPEAYEQALESNGFKIGNWARDILKKVECSKTPVEIHLTSADVAELGFTKRVSTKNLHTAIFAKGGQLCPAEVGPALRLLLKDQPNGEWRRIAMKEISDSDCGLHEFDVGRDGGALLLVTSYGRSVYGWTPGDQIVFVVP